MNDEFGGDDGSLGSGISLPSFGNHVIRFIVFFPPDESSRGYVLAEEADYWTHGPLSPTLFFRPFPFVSLLGLQVVVPLFLFLKTFCETKRSLWHYPLLPQFINHTRIHSSTVPFPLQVFLFLRESCIFFPSYRWVLGPVRQTPPYVLLERGSRQTLSVQTDTSLFVLLYGQIRN